MADEAGASSSGRAGGGGGGSGERGRGRKAKFAPTVPTRRKKAEDPGGAALSAADAAAASDAFKDLLRAAKTESSWQRGRGRGRGFGRGSAAPQTVTFGGGSGEDMRPTGRAPQPSNRANSAAEAAAAAAGAGVGDGSGPSSSKGGRLKTTGGSKSDPKRQDGSMATDADGLPELQAAEASMAQLLDYSQYYPTTLPFALHHPEDDEADEARDAALMRQGVPQDLALRPDDPEDTAQQLGLTDLSAAQDLLYLFQLPSLLPLASPARHGAKAGGSAGAGSSRAAAEGAGQSPAAARVKELPSGPLGKLLIFKSGKVKMQMGDVLLDVTAGMPCVTRQDAATINQATGHLVQLGTVTQRAVVCPDVWQLMADAPVPAFPRQLGAQQAQQAAAAAAAAAAAEAEPNGIDWDGLEDAEGEQQQQQQQHAGAPSGRPGRRRLQQLGSDSEGEDGEDKSRAQQGQSAAAAAVAAGDSGLRSRAQTRVKQAAGSPAAAAQPPGADPLLGLLALPPVASKPRAGRGRFKPSSGPASVKQEQQQPQPEAMDVDEG